MLGRICNGLAFHFEHPPIQHSLIANLRFGVAGKGALWEERQRRSFRGSLCKHGSDVLAVLSNVGCDLALDYRYAHDQSTPSLLIPGTTLSIWVWLEVQ